MADIQDALADDVTLEEFYTEWIPRLFEKRKGDFARNSEVPVILCFKFQDTGEVYTVELSEDGATVEDDEMIDFPALTLIGWAKYWPAVRRELRPLAEALDARREEVVDEYPITRAFADDFEKFDLVIDVTITGKPGDEPVKFSAVLNDYEPPDGARRFGFTLELSAIERVARGEADPVEVAKGLKISGDYAAAATFGGMIMKHLHA